MPISSFQKQVLAHDADVAVTQAYNAGPDSATRHFHTRPARGRITGEAG